MSLPLFPCPKKFTFWDTTLLPRGTFWVRVPRRPARGRPKAVFLLLACCTQEEDAGPAAHRCASSCVQQASRRSFAACSPLEPRAGLPSVPMSKIVYFLGHGFSPEAAPKYPRRKTGECPPARLLLPGGLGTPIRKMYVRRGASISVTQRTLCFFPSKSRPASIFLAATLARAAAENSRGYQ